MADRSQKQEVGDVEAKQKGVVQIGQAARNLLQVSLIFGDFGQRKHDEIDWDWVMRVVLKPHQADIKYRLKDSLFGFADVDAAEVEPVRQEDSPALALEAAKILTIDGTQPKVVDSRLPIIQT
jgi:hypothetical protein